jgi:ABC-2 type transport system permease protein
VISYIQVYHASKYTLAAWLTQLSKPLTISELGKDRLTAETQENKFITRQAWLITKKELILLIREKDALMTIVAAVFLSIASVGTYLYYGPEGVPNTSMGAYMYPGLLAVFMFLGTLMISALIGLAMISVEGRALYIIKSLPVHNLDVLKGKSLALLIIGFPIIIPMAFLLPIVAGFPLQVTIFYFLLSLVFVTSFTGIGIWGGTRFPNFDPTARNMPDIMSQFLIMSVCIICTLFIGGIPAFLMMQNNIIGLVAIIVALGWAVTIFIIALNRGQVGYEQIGSDMYM